MISKHRSFPTLSIFVAALTLFVPGPASRALDLTNGVMMAVPAPGGKQPAMDGSDTGWDLSGAEPMWVSAQTVKRMHAKLALNYDANNLYVYARVSLEGPKLTNANGPSDPFWAGDMIELRVGSDPALPFPLNVTDPKVSPSDQVCHMSFWKNTDTGKIYFSVAYGDLHGKGRTNKIFDPAGSKVAFTEETGEYVMQATVPWSALNVPGGKNPFKPGSRMTAIWGVHWGFDNQIAALYAHNPGAFAFSNWGSWGQVEFSATGNLKPRHQTMEEAIAATATAAPVGVPIVIDAPDAGKMSVNIIGEHGEVIRDITGGQEVKPGKVTVYWDGHDQWGFAMPPGKYSWGAYFSHGLKARYVGFVGSSGTPPYTTPDGKGGWGGDHGMPCAVAADASGIYFGWGFSEAEAQLVKIDYSGNTLWRKSPFIQGGFSDLHAIASNGKYLFAVYDGQHPVLSRLDVSTGVFVLFGNESGKGGTVPIAPGAPIIAPPNSLPAEGGTLGGNPRKPSPIDGLAPECIGVAATATEVFASVYSQNIIQVLDVTTGQLTRTLPCMRPRGLTLDAQGNLYAVSFGTDQMPQVVRFNGVTGQARPVVVSKLPAPVLVAPVAVAVDAAGQISVTDEGASQQIKTFSADGKLVRTLGKAGGRPWAGTYDPNSFLAPCAIVADNQGGLDVAESSIPKVFDRIDSASGKMLNHWFGWPAYGVSNIGDSDDPMTSYYPFEPEGFARATVPAEGQTGLPNASWVMKQAGIGGVGNMYSLLPYVSVLANGKKYFIDDGPPWSVSLIKGDNFTPVGSVGEAYRSITTVAGKPRPGVISRWCPMWLDNGGNAYFVTIQNSVLKIPSDGFALDGAINWNPAKASLAVPAVLPSLLNHGISGRFGMPGLRTDSKGNVYACLSANVPVLTPALGDKIKAMFPGIPQSQWCAYADPDLAKHMQEGLGHSGESNIAKFVKYGPDGKMLWIAGRKATAAPNPGEMYHFFAMAGMVDDNYAVGASEWGPMYFYTTDGFYVDSIMEDPATLPPPGPYTFGSETFGGRVQAFDKLKKVYAYNQGGIFVVDGFGADMKVEGEHRLNGTVQLDKTYSGQNQSVAAVVAPAAGLSIIPITGDILRDSTWTPVPAVTLNRAGAPLATAQLGYDASNLYARVHVVDDTPLQNGADDLNVVFKGGDVVGLDLGPGADRANNTPVLGDIRILAANIHGQSHLIAMKPVSKLAKQPQQYTTPASGTKAFDFVGEIPGGKITLTADFDRKGYTALITVPRSFIEFPITAGTNLKGDVEVLLSGAGQRGLQAVSRNWLNSGGRAQTTMVDDIPTEAWLYPMFWGDVQVK